MALNPLTLNVTSAVAGQPFTATVSGQTSGSTLDVVGYDGTPGFSVSNGRVYHPGLTQDVSTLVLRETLAGTGTRDSRISIAVDGIPLGRLGLTAALPSALSMSGVTMRTRVPRVAWAGPSHILESASPGGNGWYSGGFAGWLVRFLEDRIYTDTSMVFAAAGQGCEYFRDTLVPQVIASGADIVGIYIGSADIDAGRDIETIAAPALTAGLTMLRNAGVTSIIHSITPHGTWNATQRGACSDFNRFQWQVAFDPAMNCRYVDWNRVQVDFSTGNPINPAADTIHDSTKSGHSKALVAYTTWDSLVPKAPTRSLIDVNDVFDATLRPRGNLLGAGGMFAGTGGTVNNSGTGQLATGWTGGLNSGSASTMTVAFSKGVDASATNLPTQIVALGGTGDSSFATVGYFVGSIPAALAGQKVIFQARAKWANCDNISTIGTYAQVGDGTTTFAAFDGNGTDLNPMNFVSGPYPSAHAPQFANGILLRTPPLLIPASGATGLSFRLRVRPVSGASLAAGPVITFSEPDAYVLGKYGPVPLR